MMLDLRLRVNKCLLSSNVFQRDLDRNRSPEWILTETEWVGTLKSFTNKSDESSSASNLNESLGVPKYTEYILTEME